VLVVVDILPMLARRQSSKHFSNVVPATSISRFMAASAVTNPAYSQKHQEARKEDTRSLF
jgi:hypothetical protein